MISKFTWEGSGTEETYEYDDSGRLTRSYSKSDYLNSESSYYYDSNGFLLKRETTGQYYDGGKYAETVEIENDEQGRPIKVIVTQDGKERVRVAYEYLPAQLVIAKYSYANEDACYYVELCNEAGQRLDSIAKYEVPCRSVKYDRYLDEVEQKNADDSVETEYKFFYEDI